jgi:predicted dehydrogenase
MARPRHRHMSRREWLQAAAAATAAVAAPTIIPARALGADGNVAPSNKIALALIGCGGMGRGNLGAMLGFDDVQTVAACDVDSNQRKEALKMTHGKYGNTDAKETGDFRELVARKDIDAFIIATPDHWHGLIAVAALNAGKDCYGQKPITHTFAEGRALADAQIRNKRIWQVGSQQRSSFNFRWGVELVLNGHIGKLKEVFVGLPTGGASPEHKNQDPPPQLDYEYYCGPSKKIPYDPQIVHYNWRWNLNFGGGQLMDWIGHHNDIAHWGMGMDSSGPLEVTATAELRPDEATFNAPGNYSIDCVYEGDVKSNISNKNPMGTKWIGTDGWVFVDRGKFETSKPEWTKKEFERGPIKAYVSDNHERNFIDCVKSRKPAICPAETGHRSITPGHLGYISMYANSKKLTWDPKTETITNDAELNKKLHAFNPRDPWKIA